MILWSYLFIYNFKLMPFNNILNFLLCLMMISGWLIYNNLLKTFNSGKNVVNFIGIIILLFINENMFWKFYLLYELNILPMVLLILGYGSNPSRFSSTFYMIMYMLVFSLPVLLLNLWNWKLCMNMNMHICNYYMNKFFLKFMIFMFMVKVPIFLLHYWLLKAHVEASTMGSMILASGLLKMGSFGVFKLLMWLKIMFLEYSSYMFMGAMISCLMCLFQLDFKKFIALTSVSHMNLCLASMFCYLNFSFKSFLMMNVGHTITSCLLFYISGIMILISSSRFMFNFSMNLYNFSSVLLYLIILMNLGLPPFFTFISEMFNMSIMVYKNFMNIIIVMAIITTVTTYSLVMMNNLKKSKMKTYKLNTCNVFIFFKFMLISLMLVKF